MPYALGEPPEDLVRALEQGGDEEGGEGVGGGHGPGGVGGRCLRGVMDVCGAGVPRRQPLMEPALGEGAGECHHG